MGSVWDGAGVAKHFSDIVNIFCGVTWHKVLVGWGGKNWGGGGRGNNCLQETPDDDSTK